MSNIKFENGSEITAIGSSDSSRGSRAKVITFVDKNIVEANENIKLLISTIINLRKAKDKPYCVDPEKNASDMCEPDGCEECVAGFYENMKDYLETEYLVTDNK